MKGRKIPDSDMRGNWLWEYIPWGIKPRWYHGKAWPEPFSLDSDLWILWPFNHLLAWLRLFWYAIRNDKLSPRQYFYDKIHDTAHSEGFRQGQDYGYKLAVGIASELLGKHGIGLKSVKTAHMEVVKTYQQAQKNVDTADKAMMNMPVIFGEQDAFGAGWDAGYRGCITHVNRLLKMTPIYFVKNKVGNLVRQMDYGRVPPGVTYRWLGESVRQELEKPAEISMDGVKEITDGREGGKRSAPNSKRDAKKAGTDGERTPGGE